MTEYATTAEVADMLRCSKRKVLETARANTVGIELKGRAGWRFSPADIDALTEALRPSAPVTRRRRRAS